MRIILDVTHTSHTHAQTGIQRVCRALHSQFQSRGTAVPVCFDPNLDAWRELDPTEMSNMKPGGPAARGRGARWTLAQRISGHARRLARRQPRLPDAEGLVCPELFSPRVGARLGDLFATVGGPRVAIFHDAIGLRLPEMTPSATVARLPAYLRELLVFDGIAAVSEDSAASLRDYWRWLGATAAPPVRAIPSGLDPLPPGPAEPPEETRPRILCVATLEGRKNHVALFDACEKLWAAGLDFELELVGLARPETAGVAIARLKAMQDGGRPVQWHGAVSDARLHAAYRRCTFTVYPSLAEGFGLPVLESLQHGKPCVCSAHGAVGESAGGGGCVTLDAMDAPSIAAAAGDLLGSPGRVAALAAAARARRIRTWADYADELVDWMRGLPRRG